MRADSCNISNLRSKHYGSFQIVEAGATVCALRQVSPMVTTYEIYGRGSMIRILISTPFGGYDLRSPTFLKLGRHVVGLAKLVVCLNTTRLPLSTNSPVALLSVRASGGVSGRAG